MAGDPWPLEKLTRFEMHPPASELEIAAARVHGRPLPRDYQDFLRLANGGAGWVGKAYLELRGLDEIPIQNEGKEDIITGYSFVGSNGAGEYLAYEEATGSIVRMDGYMVDSIVYLAANMRELLGSDDPLKFGPDPE
jgi:hypothetical protein